MTSLQMLSPWQPRVMVSWMMMLMTIIIRLNPIAAQNVTEPWSPATSAHPSLQDLFQEYNRIFRYGNRNAASHRWATFLLDRAPQMTLERFEFFMAGFCAVSGSPVRANDYNRYRLSLPLVHQNQSSSSTTGATTHEEQPYVSGYMHYCCWPCVCDTQDFIRVDTRNVTSLDGVTRQRHFAVIGNPCRHPEQLQVPFVQPFYGRRTTTLAETAQEVRCDERGELEGATVSDHGYIIIGAFFDAQPVTDVHPAPMSDDPTPGRIHSVSVPARPSQSENQNEPTPPATTQLERTSTPRTILYQDERDWEARCQERAANGYNSGMGEIFRKVSAISPIPLEEAGPRADASCPNPTTIE